MFAAVLLAIVAGCADAIGLLRFNTFAGAMTGNTAFLGLSLLSPHPARAVLYVAVIAAFCAGVVLARTAQRLGAPLRPLLVLTILVLIGCNFGHSRWIAAALAAAMGTQNAAARRVAMALNTTFLTGDLQKLMNGIATYLTSSPQRARESARTRHDRLPVDELCRRRGARRRQRALARPAVPRAGRASLAVPVVRKYPRERSILIDLPNCGGSGRRSDGRVVFRGFH